MAEYIQVMTTTATREDAARIAAVLLENRLAACVQVMGPIESHYRWKGTLERSSEWLCLVKTTRGNYRAVEEAIHANHFYEVPEVIACPIESGSEAYLAWLRAETEG